MSWKVLLVMALLIGIIRVGSEVLKKLRNYEPPRVPSQTNALRESPGSSHGGTSVPATASPTTKVNQAESATFASPRGFAFRYPGNWIVATKENRDAAIADVKSRINIRELDLNKVAVVVFDPAGDCAWCPSVHVEVSPIQRTGSLTQASVDEVVKGIRGQFGNIGITPATLVGKLESFGGRQAASIRLDVTYPGQSFQLSQWQVIFPGARQAYYVNASAKTLDFERYKPVFEAILNSFELDLAPSKPTSR